MIGESMIVIRKFVIWKEKKNIFLLPLFTQFFFLQLKQKV